MLVTTICLLQLFSQLHPAKGETTGELLESVGKRTQGESFDQISCSFNINITLSHVDLVNKTGSKVFAIVDCGTKCKVLSNYQDVLRIVSPENTSFGDYFVFNAKHSEKTIGRYTCHGIHTPQVASPPPSGNGDGDGDGDGDESQKTSVPLSDTDEASHNAGGNLNGLFALFIIPIVVVPIVVISLYRRGVIRIPCRRKTGGKFKSDLPYLVEESFGDDRNDERKDGEMFVVKEQQPLLRVSYNSTKPTHDKNVYVQEGHTLPQSTLSPDSTELKGDNGDAEEHQTSLQSSVLSNSIKSTDVEPVAADLIAAASSGGGIQHKGESAPTERQTLKPPVPPKTYKDRDQFKTSPTTTLTTEPGNGKFRDVTSDSCLPSPPSWSVIDHKKSEDNATGRPSPTVKPKPSSAESGSNVAKMLALFEEKENTQHHSDAMGEIKRGENQSKKGQLKTAQNTEDRKGNKEKEGERALIDMKEKESSEAKSETRNNDYMKGQYTTDENKEDTGGNKEREDEKANVEMEEKEIIKIQSETENKEDARQKQEQIKETMAGKVEQEHKEEAKMEVGHPQEVEVEYPQEVEVDHPQEVEVEHPQEVEVEHPQEVKVEHPQEVEAEAVRELKADTRAETVQTNEELDKNGHKDDGDDGNSSRDAEGAVAVDKLDGASSSGQNLVYTDQPLPEHSQKCSEGERKPLEVN